MAQANGERAKFNDGEIPPVSRELASHVNSYSKPYYQEDNPGDDSLDGCIWLTEEQVDGITKQIEEEWAMEDGTAPKRQKRKLKDFSNYPYGLWDMPVVWKFDGNHSKYFSTLLDATMTWWL
jgi:hypothetical protein